ncbi:uncharacterized protein LOC116403900 [Cucumis sativus]|uniref:uncharacterized protein LOC116403900 n=1 Tax=Cucumis sativus TaxID=3659 RepID=UPI0012F4E57A|nr:uncharacterized protein LOC116403900 [Cucumis sativus]
MVPLLNLNVTIGLDSRKTVLVLKCFRMVSDKSVMSEPELGVTPHCIVLLLVYVDDTIITGNDLQAISDLQHYLGQHFEMKDLGSLNYFLGLEVSRRSDVYLLSQEEYASDLLARSGIIDSITSSTPLDPNTHLTPFDSVPLEDVSLYRQLVGSLIYLTVTRSDIAYAIPIFSSQSSPVLSGYSDADWAGDPTDRRSTTGYCFYLNDSLISWRSKKQSVVSRSSTELEYRALDDTTALLLWLCWLLADMGAPQQGPLSFIVTIVVLFRLLTMMSFMNV